MTGFGFVGRLAFTALAAVLVVAVWIQDHGGALPLGLFNERRELLEALSWVCLAAACTLLLVFLVEWGTGRALALAGLLRGALASLLLFEVLLFGIDVSLVSRGEDPPLGGPYRELRSHSGEWLFVKKPHAGSSLGFRRDESFPAHPDAPRVLFLGDSYTEGSGRGPACNYPEVATATLADALGRPLQVVNAGVAGYGPVDALRLFEHLLAEEERIDAVVLSLFVENDFTDNLPGTTRRVVAGVNFRFPTSRFLRTFHPLNSRSFRYVVFAEGARRLVRGSGAPARRARGRCRLEPQSLGPVPEELERLVRRRSEALHGPAPRLALGPVREALTGLRERARREGLPAHLVVFPDRISADSELAAALDLAPSADSAERIWGPLRAAWPDLIDLRGALEAGAENYRRNDTHLSDLGNLRAGRAAGRALALRLREEPSFARSR